jgi:hypothetical protein
VPVVYQNTVYPWQVSFGGVQAPSTQLNFREMLNEVTDWNPNVDPMTAGRWINNYYRKVIDMRTWYGLKLRGQVSVIQPVNSGQVSSQYGNPTITGIGTSWDQTLVGLQFRTGFTYGYQTIVEVNEGAQTLQLDTPFAGAAGTNTTGYIIVEAYVDFGANIKRLLWATNQQQGWPMTVNIPVQTINQWDVWRQSLGWSTVFATRSPSPAGGMICECWPTPFSNQVFPFEAYQMPPVLVNDDDAMVSWIPSDLIVTRAVADALVYKGRRSPYYDPTTAGLKRQEFNERVESAAQADNNMDQQDVTWDYGEEDGRVGFGPGSTYAQNHD